MLGRHYWFDGWNRLQYWVEVSKWRFQLLLWKFIWNRLASRFWILIGQRKTLWRVVHQLLDLNYCSSIYCRRYGLHQYCNRNLSPNWHPFCKKTAKWDLRCNWKYERYSLAIIHQPCSHIPNHLHEVKTFYNSKPSWCVLRLIYRVFIQLVCQSRLNDCQSYDYGNWVHPPFPSQWNKWICFAKMLR